jgi:hypothetical protein
MTSVELIWWCARAHSNVLAMVLTSDLVTCEYQIDLAESVGCVPALWVPSLRDRRLPRVSVNLALLGLPIPCSGLTSLDTKSM